MYYANETKKGEKDAIDKETLLVETDQRNGKRKSTEALQTVAKIH